MSMILRAYKTELDPTCKQVRLLLQHAGAARWAFNWGLHKKIEAYKETGKSPSAIDLHRELNLLKKLPIEEGGIPWMYESSKCAPQEKLRDLDIAYKNFFRRCKEGAKQKGFPRFKSRKKGIGSFRLTGSVRASGTHVQLPVIGELKLKERGYIPTEGVKILSATISEAAGRWYVSLQVKKEYQPHRYPFEHLVGVDVGIKHLAITSDGEVFENPHALVGLQSILRVRQKAVSRKKKGSHNRRKAVHRLAVLHERIANVRKDAIHKMTSSIAKSASVVVIESLNISGMLKNHHLARSLSDAALGEIHRQLRYKMRWSGGEILEADSFYPSSKRCSKCGHVKKELLLSERTYYCGNPECSLVIDRDLNAALNLKLWPQVHAVAACCPGSSGRGHKTSTKLPVGQETRRENQTYV
jgi:putative transposase